MARRRICLALVVFAVAGIPETGLAAARRKAPRSRPPQTMPAAHRPDPDLATRLRDAVRKASRAGKPLLVFVRTSRGQANQARSETFGHLVFEPSDELAALLAQCEIAIASPTEVANLVSMTGPEPLLVLIETDTLALTAGRAESPPDLQVIHTTGRWEAAEKAEKAEEDRQVVARLDALLPALRALIAGDAATAERRARQTAAVVPQERIDAVLAVLAEGLPPQAADVDAVAGAVAALARKEGGDGPARRALAAAWRDRVKRGAVPGTARRWEDPCPSCGMGRVSARSREFLDLFTGSQDEYRDRGSRSEGGGEGGLW